MKKVRNRKLKLKKIQKFKKMKKDQINSTATLIWNKSRNLVKMGIKYISKEEFNLVSRINQEGESIANKDKVNMLHKEIIVIELYMKIKYTSKSWKKMAQRLIAKLLE